jgi:hypothetical protein
VVRTVVGVRLTQGVRIDSQASHEVISVLRDPLFLPHLTMGCPQGDAAQRAFEVADGRHRHGIDHLLMELRLALGRCQAVRCEQIGIVEVYGLVGATARRIDVNDLDILAPWARGERPGFRTLPRNSDGRLAQVQCVEAVAEQGVRREDAKPAGCGRKRHPAARSPGRRVFVHCIHIRRGVSHASCTARISMERWRVRGEAHARLSCNAVRSWRTMSSSPAGT